MPDGIQVQSELLTGARFVFEATNRVQQRPILEITGMSVECPPADNNAVLGSMIGGQCMRQATPTRPKFNVLSLKLVLEANNTELFDWYKMCNNESQGNDWMNERQDATITAYMQDGTPAAEWTVLYAYPVKYAGPEFQSGDETMANETIDIVYEDFLKEL